MTLFLRNFTSKYFFASLCISMFLLMNSCEGMESTVGRLKSGNSDGDASSFIGTWTACQNIDENGDGVFDKDTDWSLKHRVEFSESSLKRTISNHAMSFNCEGFNYSDNEISMAYKIVDPAANDTNAMNIDYGAINLETLTLHSEPTVVFYNSYDISGDEYVGAFGKTNWEKDVPMPITGIRFDGAPYQPEPTFSLLKLVDGRLYFGKPSTDSSDDNGSSPARRHATIDMEMPFTKRLQNFPKQN